MTQTIDSLTEIQVVFVAHGATVSGSQVVHGTF